MVVDTTISWEHWLLPRRFDWWHGWHSVVYGSISRSIGRHIESLSQSLRSSIRVVVILRSHVALSLTLVTLSEFAFVLFTSRGSWEAYATVVVMT